MILSREKITKLAEEKKLIKPFNPKNLTGAGYDLTAGKFYELKGSAHLGTTTRTLPSAETKNQVEVILKPNTYLLIETIEEVNMPVNLVARIHPRSTIFRSGCSLLTAVVDPGYYGTLTMGLTNLSNCEFRLERGARIAQIVFEEVSEGSTPYDGRYQGGKIV